MTSTLLISDSINVSSKDNEDIMLWSGNNKINGKNFFSLLDIVEKNAEYCKTEYVSFVSQLGEEVVNNKKVIDHLKIDKNLSFWWTTLIVEKSNLYNSIGVYSFMFLQSFKKFGIIDPLLTPP